MRWFAGGLGDFRKTGFELEYALFFGLIFLSLLWTPDAERGFMHALRVLVLSGILYLFVNWLRQPREAVWILGTLAVISVFLGALAIYSTINNPQAIIQDVLTDGTRNASRARIGQHDPNVFASMFFLPMAFTAAVVFSKSQPRTTGSGGRGAGRHVCGRTGDVFAKLLGFRHCHAGSAGAAVPSVPPLHRGYHCRHPAYRCHPGVPVHIHEHSEPVYQSVHRRTGHVQYHPGDAGRRVGKYVFSTAGCWALDGVVSRMPCSVTTTSSKPMVFFEPHNVTYLVYAELGLIGLLLFGFIVYKIAYIAWQNFRMADTVELKIVTSATGVTFLAYSIFYQFLGSGFLDNQLWITTGIILAMHIYLRMPERTANRHGAPG